MRSIHPLCAIGAALALAGAAHAASANANNPAISVILDGRYSSFGEDPLTYHLPGFQLGPESGPGARGFAFHEGELMLTSNVDDMFTASLIVSFGQDAGETATEIEEAWNQTTSLPEGFVVKAGKLFSRAGYLNERHPHGWDFADAPLVTRAFFGGNLGDSGVQVRWIAPTDLYLELGGEWFAGDAWPAAGAGDQGRGMHTLFAKLGGDLDDSNSWQVGVSRISAQAIDRLDEPLDPTAPPPLAFTGDSVVTGIDLVWKWAPDGNYKDRNLTLTAEMMRRSEDGAVATDFGSGPESGAYHGTQRGWYAQGAWQFMPQWRVGLRLDQLSSDNTVTGLSQPTVLDDGGHSPKRTTVMVDYSHTEYSRIRLQYVVSIGPHGAHQF